MGKELGVKVVVSDPEALEWVLSDAARHAGSFLEDLGLDPDLPLTDEGFDDLGLSPQERKDARETYRVWEVVNEALADLNPPELPLFPPEE